MAKYCQKNGRVYRVFNTPFTDWNNPPDENLDFPNTFICENNEDLKAQVGQDVIIIDRPQPTPQIESKPSGLPLGAIVSALAGMNIPQAAKDAIMARQSENPGQEEGKVVTVKVPREEVEYQNKMLQEFRLVLASMGNAYSKQEVEAIGNYILAVDPSLEVELVKAKLASTNRRFTL